MNRLLNPIFAALLGSMLAMPALAADAACQPVSDASAKISRYQPIYLQPPLALPGGKPEMPR